MATTVKKTTMEMLCPQLGTTDYLSFDDTTTFNDLINQLKEKYEDEILVYIHNFQNIRQGISLDEVTIKLHYIDRSGVRETVGLFAKVSEVRKNQKITKIYWEAEPIGGLTDF